ncbi:hypothetical protein AK812_SmicGene35981 [Symbiodinium microadriaticum]|uniref:Uncharacterized protein n=1 Tax=Symbiodinium microadriaticum TaxID=2951 RepID=A0A1Q9CK08_SYMMI|nr:hypothetical protein AK812_SmicGene35981 [Symbiodinium microadriaticum]
MAILQRVHNAGRKFAACEHGPSERFGIVAQDCAVLASCGRVASKVHRVIIGTARACYASLPQHFSAQSSQGELVSLATAGGRHNPHAGRANGIFSLLVDGSKLCLRGRNDACRSAGKVLRLSLAAAVLEACLFGVKQNKSKAACIGGRPGGPVHVRPPACTSVNLCETD